MKKFIFYFFTVLPFYCFAQEVNNRGIKPLNNSQKVIGQTYAIVIGISKYKEVNPLQFADKDARVFAHYLIDKKGMRLDSNNVMLFVNESATLNNIGNRLTDIYPKLQKGDKVIFFFAGHGDYDANVLKDQALLLLYGAPKQNYFQNMFTGDFLSTADLNSRFIEPLMNKGCEVMLFIDACHATGIDKSLSGGAEGGKITMQALQNMTSPVKIYSCMANEYSLESAQWGGGRGLFSYELMEGLYGMADANHDSMVTLRELQRFLEDNVSKMAAPNKQDPIVKIDDGDEVVAKVNYDLLAEYTNRKDKKLEFINKADLMGNTDVWFRDMDSLQRKFYREIDSLIAKKELDSAYNKYLFFAKIDSSSDVSLQLKRNLSAALQQKTALILTPLLEDVSKFKASVDEVVQAEKDLEKAAILLGEKHFLYKNLEARILFLKEIILKANKGSQSDKIKYLEQSIVLEPNAPYTYIELAYQYQVGSQNNLEKAKEYYKKYLDLMPKNKWAYFNLGVVQFDLNNYNEAIKNYKKAIEIDPAISKAYNNLALSFQKLKNYDEAIINYKKSIELDPKYADAYNNIGSVYNELKNYDEAIKNLKKAIELEPKHSDAFNNLGLVYDNLKNYDEAVKNYKQAIIIEPKNADAYINLGAIYEEFRKYSEAIKILRQAILIDSNSSNVFYHVGILYNKLKNYEEAIKYFKKASKLDPNNAIAFNILGSAYQKLKNYDEAINNFNQAIKIEPGFSKAYNNLGLVYNELENYNEAINNFKKAIEIDQKYSEAYYNLGVAYLNLKNSDEAIKNYNKSIELDPKNSIACYNLGIVYNDLKKYTEAIKNYQQAIIIDSSFSDAYYNLGLVYFQIKNYDESIKNLTKFIGLGNNDDEVYFILCRSYCLQKDFTAALKYLEESIERKIVDLKIISTNASLYNIRSQPEFKTLLKKHFTKEELDKYPQMFISGN